MTNKAIKIHWLKLNEDASEDNLPQAFASSFDDRNVRVSGVSPEQCVDGGGKVGHGAPA
jgi:hypothetical protein